MARRTRGVLTAVVAVLILLYVSPVIYMAQMSFKKPIDLFSTWFFFKPTLENYVTILTRMDIPTYLANSAVVASIAAVGSICAGFLAAYAFARYQFKGKVPLLFMVLFTRMLPPIAGVVPLFLIMGRWGLTDTRLGLAVLYTALQVPFVVWMLRGFLVDIPPELEEAAMVDGATRFVAVRKVIMPLAAPGIAATGIFAFVLSWNEFLFALVFTGANAKTAPVAVPELIGELGIYWGQITAAGTLLVLPVFILAFLIERYLVQGMTFGAVKG